VYDVCVYEERFGGVYPSHDYNKALQRSCMYDILVVVLPSTSKGPSLGFCRLLSGIAHPTSHGSQVGTSHQCKQAHPYTSDLAVHHLTNHKGPSWLRHHMLLLSWQRAAGKLDGVCLSDRLCRVQCYTCGYRQAAVSVDVEGASGQRRRGSRGERMRREVVRPKLGHRCR
jgi:hypothetical protein